MLSMFPQQRQSQAATRALIKHDDNGQVYTETSCRGGPMTADWVWKTQGSSKEMGKFTSLGPGCSSLVNMAIRSVLYSSYSITAESLANVPWEIGSMLWKRLVASQLDSVQVWKAFASTYAMEDAASLRHKYKMIERPNMRLLDYITPIVSPQLHWITFLSLSSLICSRTDLIRISQLSNLGVLNMGPDITSENGGIDDSIMRSWGRIAAKSEDFSMLRVLSLRSQKNITRRIADYLHDFPALAVLNVENCGLDHEFRTDLLSRGWRKRVGKPLQGWLTQGGAKDASWDSVMHACFALGGAFSEELLSVEGVEAISSLPRLHITLGPPLQSAAFDCTKGGSKERRCLESFSRSSESVQGQGATKESCSKRPLSQDNSLHVRKTMKRPGIRPSKIQDMEGLLIGMGG